MKIDSHQHFWRYDPKVYAWITEDMHIIRRDFMPKDLIPLLYAAGFDGCIAVQADQSEAETRFLLELADQYDFIQGVVGWVDLISKEVEVHLSNLSNHPKLKGIRHIVQGEPDDYFLLREDFINGISHLKGFNLVYDILIYPRQLPAAIEFVRRFPQQVFVLDHIAKPFIKSGVIERWATHIRELAITPNVYCKLSGMVTEADWQNWTARDMYPYLDIVVEAFGTKRLMIGSDWPVCLVASSYEKAINLVKEYISQFSEKEQIGILGQNAVHCYKL